MTERIQHAIFNISKPGVSESAYDIAWVSRVSTDGETPLFPSTLYWIVENQRDDGSWGADNEYYHDRVICTLSCILALKQYNLNRQYQSRIERGEKYICENIKNLSRDAYATVGFEVLFPKLMRDAWHEGMCLSCIYSPVAEYIRLRKEKMKKLEKYVLFKPTTLLHSLECFDDDFDFSKVLAFKARNGSFLNSPSSTALVHMKTGDTGCLKYLTDVVEKFNGAVPVNYPLDIFRANWILDDIYTFELEEYFKDEVNNLTQYIYSHWTEKGLSWSKEFDLPDLDNTAVGFRNLFRKGYAVSEEVFKHFFDGEQFYCFEGELDSGPSHIANLLRTLNMLPRTDFIVNARRACIDLLVETRSEDWSWDDKWHVSKLYVTSRVFAAMEDNNEWNRKIKKYFEGVHALFNLTLDEEYYMSLIFKQDMFSDRAIIFGSKQKKFWIDKVLYRVEL